MRLLVVGAGATGGYFGGRLAQAGRDVTFLVRPGRATQLRANGLQIVSPLGDVTLAPKIVTAGEIEAPYDAILLTVKAYSLEAALDDVAAAVGPQSMIIPVLNGMRHVDRIIERFGSSVLVGGVCKVATMLDDQARIVQLAKFNELVYGEMNGEPSSRTQDLHAFMQGASFDAKLSTTIEREMWEKWLFLATLGASTCLMRGNVGEINAAPGGVEFLHAIMDEVVAVVRAAGQSPDQAFVDNIRASLAMKGSTQAPSMFRDLQKGAAVEADQIIGDLLTRGAGLNVSTPLLAAAYTNLSVYQRRLAA